MSDPLCECRQMSKNTRRVGRTAKAVKPNQTIDLHDFEQLAGEALQIEHQTIPGFLRRLPHKWHLTDITRFGDQVGRVSEAMQMAYITAVDKSLGVIRAFPLPLLQRVYEIMAPQFNWPMIIDAPELEDGRRAQRDALQKNERLTAQIRDLMSDADEPPIIEAASVILNSLEANAAKLRESIDAPVTG
jgi:hypothetical protein